jgi:superfamily II DNA or RNA helicase
MKARGISPEDAKSIVDEIYKKGAWIAVLRLPTGFGKSTSASVIFSELYERGLAYNMIHVLPLRAIVEQQYRKLACAAEDGPQIVYESLRKAGIGRGDIVLAATNASGLLGEMQVYTDAFWKLAAVAVAAILNECDERVAHDRRR